MTQLTENFTLEEFNCKDGTVVPTSLMPAIKKLAGELQILRNLLGEPIHINSGYRSPAYNKKVGGKPNSYHMKAMAADITVKSMRPKQLAAFIEKEIAKGTLKFGGLGIYPGFIHVDIRAQKARW